jgi:serine/threonine protein kinase
MDRYQFVAKIGEGSFGSVGEYLDARKRFTRVAIKTMPASERDSFIQEHNILHQLRHTPYVTTMLDAFEENGKCFIVMRRADRTLGKLIQESGPMDLQTVLHITRQIAMGMTALHAAGWTHTDVKPENIVVYDDMHVQMIDFGCCMRPDSTGTAPSGIPTDPDGHYYLTTRWYRAPEVVLATDDVLGHKIDVWALGCIVVQMLTGLVLFPASDEEDLVGMMEIFLGPIPPGLLAMGATTPFIYGRRADMSLRSSPELSKASAHHRTRWMKYTKMCWTMQTDAFEMSEYIQFARIDQSHIFNGLDLAYFQRVINWNEYLNMLYAEPEHPHATLLRRVVRATLVYNPDSRASAETLVEMLSSPDDA